MKKIIILFLLVILLLSSITVAPKLNTERDNQNEASVQIKPNDPDDTFLDFIEELFRRLNSVIPLISSDLGDNFIIGPLLDTEWYQKGLYAEYAPIKDLRTGEHHRLGCWSVALAQILYYYRAETHGFVSYDTSEGCEILGGSCHIEEDLNYEWDWSLFANKLDTSAPRLIKDTVAKYCYFTSVVVQKDFGTGGYVLDHDKREVIEDHYYSIRAKYYTTWDEEYTVDEIKDIVISEIMQGYPVMMHLNNKSNSSQWHAIAVDGVAKINGNYVFHMNLGYHNRSHIDSGGWYDYNKFGKWDNESYRSIITVRKLSLGPFGLHVPVEKRVDPLLNKNTILAKLNMRDPEEFLQYVPEAGYDTPWIFYPAEQPRILNIDIPDDIWENDPP